MPFILRKYILIQFLMNSTENDKKILILTLKYFLICIQKYFLDINFIRINSFLKCNFFFRIKA
jgi:hypothetical protein